MITGVSQGYLVRLYLVGIGYRISLENNNLVLKIGYSNPIIQKIPDDINVKIENPTIMIISGIDKAKVNGFASIIRSYKKPEPYKGKGITYKGEFIRRKIGKKK